MSTSMKDASSTHPLLTYCQSKPDLFYQIKRDLYHQRMLPRELYLSLCLSLLLELNDIISHSIHSHHSDHLTIFFFVLFSHPSLFSPSRTHYRLSRIEILQGMANRFVHSTFYLYFYASMAVASLLTVFLSLFQDCPGSLFYGLELGINLVLIAEVGVRMGAFGKVSS